jgi:apolipoprotein N-acyltransferase
MSKMVINMSLPLSVFSVILSAIMLSLGIPNELFKQGSALFGILALLPLYPALRDAKSWARAGCLGGLMMFLVHALSSFWLAYFKDFAIFTLGGSALLNFFFGILVGWLLRASGRFSRPVRPFLFAAIWVVWEWFKSSGFLAYPWGTLVMSSRELTGLIQIAEITGVWGISFLMALFPAIVAETITAPRSLYPHDATLFDRKRSLSRALAESPSWSSFSANLRSMKAPIVFTAFIFALATGFGLWRLASPPKPETTLNVVLVQQNGDPWVDGGLSRNLLVSQKLTREAIAKSGKKADLVVWSESVLSWPYRENAKYYRKHPRSDPFVAFMASTGVPLLVGSPVLVDPLNDGYSNGVVYIAPDGEQLGWYGKMQLVGFAEYMPFTEYAWVRNFFDAVVGFSSGWIPGTEYTTFPVTNGEGKTIRFAAPICFEDAFPSLIARLHNAGSDILINLTNDSWSRTDSAEFQHFAIASFRAIELRTTLVRSTNAGYSVVIDPLGRVIFDMPLFVEDAVNVPVPVYPHRTTLYARFGDWFPALMSLLALAAIAISEFIDRRRYFR